jgi:hypothetical protein
LIEAIHELPLGVIHELPLLQEGSDRDVAPNKRATHRVAPTKEQDILTISLISVNQYQNIKKIRHRLTQIITDKKIIFLKIYLNQCKSVSKKWLGCGRSNKSVKISENQCQNKGGSGRFFKSVKISVNQCHY